jgi:ribosome biogenesis GTPase / thiamine phosphate phosphatase
MNYMFNKIIKFGFNEAFQNKIDCEKYVGFNIARVLTVHKEGYTITNGDKDMPAEVTGKIIYNSDSPIDFPTVGDWVMTQEYDQENHAIIHEIVPRNSLLKRKTSGKNVEFQLIAANVDIAFVIQSLDTNFNIRRLERYLAMIYESNIEPVLLLSKSDLLDQDSIEKHLKEIKELAPSLSAIPFSNTNKSNLDSIKDILKPCQTYCFLGSSGVGKTTLLNNLIGDSVFKTTAVREKDSKGRHATTQRQLTKLDSGAMIIDTPGMRELANFSVESGIDETFHDITELANSCKFSDCSHVNEKGCAILKAIEDETLSSERYQNYIKMKKESQHYEMSYYDKRQKDKRFAKFCKTVMKHKTSHKYK